MNEHDVNEHKEKKVHEPLFHITKRAAMPWYKAWAVRGISIILALVVCAVITVLLTGENPLAVYATMFRGAFGTTRRIWVLFQNVAILLCIAIAITPAFFNALMSVSISPS